MAVFLTTDTELTSIANAIRSKGSTSETLVYPNGFISAINSISGGGEDHTAEDGIIDKTISGIYENSRITIIKYSAFCDCLGLTSVVFQQCSSIGDRAFRNCEYLTTASFPSCTYIDSRAFQSCFRLVSFYLMGSTIPSLPYSNAFTSTPLSNKSDIAGQWGSIYVPASLLSSYKTTSGWSVFSNRFVGI